jgi:hypothetical protein
MGVGIGFTFDSASPMPARAAAGTDRASLDPMKESHARSSADSVSWIFILVFALLCVAGVIIYSGR